MHRPVTLDAFFMGTPTQTFLYKPQYFEKVVPSEEFPKRVFAQGCRRDNKNGIEGYNKSQMSQLSAGGQPLRVTMPTVVHGI